MSNAFDKSSLVMLPHAYEEGKLYSLKPTDRSGDFTFSRGADTATRVGEDGYIKKEHSNLLLQSNNFNTTWTLTPATTLLPNQSGYDGTNDAWMFRLDGLNNRTITQSVSVNGVSTFSVYAKKGTIDIVNVRTSGSISYGMQFNLSTGTTGNRIGTAPISSKIESAGNGWYKCSIVVNASTTSVLIQAASTEVGQYLYIQDAQINQGLVATPYLETTTAPVFGGLTDNMPRLDYTDATCPSLLLEPERTNLWYHSEYYDSLSNSNGPVFEYNDGISPEGIQNAVRVSAQNVGSSRLQPNLGVNGNQICWSLYVKHEGEDYTMRLNNYLGGTDTYGAEVTVTSTSITFDGYASGYTDADYEVIGDGWFRFWIIFTPAAGGQLFQWRVLQTGSIATSYLAYGMQVEQGSYPTSYIPTYGSAQTRLNDSFIDLVYNLGTSFSIFVEADNLDSNSANAFFMRFGNTGPYLYLAVTKSIKKLTWYTSDGTGYMSGSGNKIALSYDGTTWTWAADGESSSKAAGANDVVFDKIKIATNGSAGGGLPKLSLKKFILFDEVLTASELEALTT